MPTNDLEVDVYFFVIIFVFYYNHVLIVNPKFAQSAVYPLECFILGQLIGNIQQSHLKWHTFQ